VTRRTAAAVAEPLPDPFGERRRPAWRERRQLLGARFEFESDTRALIEIVRTAYARLPTHSLTRQAPQLRVRLALNSGAAVPPLAPRREPPRVQALSGAGLLCGAVGPASFVALSPQQRSALIVVAGEMLRYPYHLRYELLEFAVYVLATRVQRLVPLHAGCWGRNGRGLLLIGASGAGKSTLVLQALLDGLELLAEDSVLVKPAGLMATGVANFLHLRRDSLRFVARSERAALSAAATLIRRRSGVQKLAIDLRRLRCRLAAAPQRICALVFISRRRAGRGPLLRPLPRGNVLRRLAATQRYAAQQAGWPEFLRRVAALPAYELRRGGHPRASLAALCEVLAANSSRRGRAAPRAAKRRRRPAATTAR
jgi:hypothetical protein